MLKALFKREVADLSRERDVERVAPGRPRSARLWLRAEARPYLLFLVAWVFLSVSMNARYPAARFHDPHRFWFLPSPDVTAVFGLLCLLALLRRRLPSKAMGALVALFLVCRFLRVGDGIAWRFFVRPFSVVIDAPLTVELVRLLWTTTPRWKFALGAVAFAGALVGFVYGTRAALRYAERYLARPEGRAAFAGTAALFAAASLVAPPPFLPAHRSGAFGTSAFARLGQEADFLLHFARLREDRWRPLLEADARMRALPSALPGLGSADVFLFLVESYGHAVVSVPAIKAGVEPAWRRFERELAAGGYGVRSSWITSPTYGGGSWLAQATLASGGKVGDQFAHHLLAGAGAKSMPWAMRRAGYRTAFAAPGMTRTGWAHGPFFDFDQVYCSWNFDYKGPKFNWASMPDQYVIDFMHRREVEGREGPVFVEYALISSHGPFDVQPPYLDDWSRLGDGAIFNELGPVTFDGLTWSNQQDATAAYARALAYDFEVLAAYATRSLRRKSLIILIGDHQPTPELTGHDPEWTVPIHVLSRDPELLAPFARRGYGEGMTPAGPPQPMESFVFTFFENYSAG
jgi:sulfatase-like protein